MNIGIEAMEFYAPKTYVDQTDLGILSTSQNNTSGLLLENILRD